jgi:heterodisulfide reductase subunit A-like polyferredoxin
LRAIVDQDRCLLCGICADMCPEDAIAVNDTAVVDLHKCTGCGECVDECPEDAIALAEWKERG